MSVAGGGSPRPVGPPPSPREPTSWIWGSRRESARSRGSVSACQDVSARSNPVGGITTRAAGRFGSTKRITRVRDAADARRVRAPVRARNPCKPRQQPSNESQPPAFQPTAGHSASLGWWPRSGPSSGICAISPSGSSRCTTGSSGWPRLVARSATQSRSPRSRSRAAEEDSPASPPGKHP
jgi:hypothetical protein